jgi:hypothetical protein
LKIATLSRCLAMLATASAADETGTSMIRSIFLAVVPGRCDVGRHIGLGEEIRRNQFDIEITMHLAEIFDRKLGRRHRALAAVVGVRSGHVGEDAVRMGAAARAGGAAASAAPATSSDLLVNFIIFVLSLANVRIKRTPASI